MRRKLLVGVALSCWMTAQANDPEMWIDQQFTTLAGEAFSLTDAGEVVRLDVQVHGLGDQVRYGLRPRVLLPEGIQVVGIESYPAAALVPRTDGALDWHLDSHAVGGQLQPRLELLLQPLTSAVGKTLTTTASLGGAPVDSVARLRVKSLASVDLAGDISVLERRNGNDIEVVFTMTVTNVGPEAASDVQLALVLDQGLLDEIEDRSRFEPDPGVVCDDDALTCEFGSLAVNEEKSVDAVLVFVPGDGGFAMTMDGTFDSNDTDVDSSNNRVNLSYVLDRGDIRDEAGGGSGSAGWWLLGVLGLLWLAAFWRRR